MAYRGKSKGSYGNQRHGRSSWRGSGKAKHDSVLARESFESRSKRSQAQDLRMSAPIAKNIHAYLKAPTETDWLGVDSPSKLVEFAKKDSQIEIRDSKTKKTHRFKIVKKAEAKKEPEKQELKAEANNPIKEESSHKLPSAKEILEKAQQLYMKDNGRMDFQEGVGTNLPERNELAEEGYLQKAKLALMTSEDTVASRQVGDYVENLRTELNKLGFEVIPMEGFSVEDLKY